MTVTVRTFTYPTGTPSGDYLDGILNGVAWSSTNSTVTWSMPQSASNYATTSSPYSEQNTGFNGFNSAQQTTARAAFAYWNSITAYTFQEITETDSVHADIRLACSDVPGTGGKPTAYTWPLSAGAAYEGDAWFQNGTFGSPQAGNYAWYGIWHETCHQMGLRHGQDAGATFPVLPADNRCQYYSIVTYPCYPGAVGTYTNETWGGPQTLSILEILAGQFLYGTNASTTQQVCSIDPATGIVSINGTPYATPGDVRVYFSIPSNSGYQTLDLSNNNGDQTISMLANTWNTIAGIVTSQVASAHFVPGHFSNQHLRETINTVILGSGTDTVAVNSLTKVLTKNSGTGTGIFRNPLADYSFNRITSTYLQVTDTTTTDGVTNLDGAGWISMQFSDGTVPCSNYGFNRHAGVGGRGRSLF